MSIIPEDNLKLVHRTGQAMVNTIEALEKGKMDVKTAREISRSGATAINALASSHIKATKAAAQALNAETRAKREERLAKESEKHSLNS